MVDICMIPSFKKKPMIYKQLLIYLFFHFYFNAIDTGILTARSEFFVEDSWYSSFPHTVLSYKPERRLTSNQRGLHWLWFLTIWHAHSIKRGREGGHTFFVNENVDYSLLKELPSHPIFGGVKKFKVYVINVSVFSFCLL